MHISRKNLIIKAITIVTVLLLLSSQLILNVKTWAKCFNDIVLRNKNCLKCVTNWSNINGSSTRHDNMNHFMHNKFFNVASEVSAGLLAPSSDRRARGNGRWDHRMRMQVTQKHLQKQRCWCPLKASCFHFKPTSEYQSKTSVLQRLSAIVCHYVHSPHVPLSVGGSQTAPDNHFPHPHQMTPCSGFHL